MKEKPRKARRQRRSITAHIYTYIATPLLVLLREALVEALDASALAFLAPIAFLVLLAQGPVVARAKVDAGRRAGNGRSRNNGVCNFRIGGYHGLELVERRR